MAWTNNNSSSAARNGGGRRQGGSSRVGKTEEADDTTLLGWRNLVGAVVQVKTMDDNEWEAEVFAYDTRSRMVVLATRVPQMRRRHINVVRDTFVKSVKYLRKEPRTDLTKPLPALQYKALKQREERAIERAQARAAAAHAQKGVGVSPFGQQLFNSLAKTLQCKWDGKTIVVMDQVRIKEPYRAEDCSASAGGDVALARIRRIVGSLQSRLKS